MAPEVAAQVATAVDNHAPKAVQVARAMAHPPHAEAVLHKALVVTVLKEVLIARQWIASMIATIDAMTAQTIAPMTEVWIGTWIATMTGVHAATNFRATLIRS